MTTFAVAMNLIATAMQSDKTLLKIASDFNDLGQSLLTVFNP